MVKGNFDWRGAQHNKNGKGQLDRTCEVADCGNGTAGTAMAVPAFEGEKWRRLDSNLTL